MIAIVTGPMDPHADRVEAVLAARGEAHVRIRHEDFPRSARVAVRYDRAGLTRALWRTDGQDVDLAALTSIWWRRPERPDPGPLGHPGVRAFVSAECADTVDDVWDLDLVPALPGPRPVLRRAQYKARQLVLAGRLGFELPPTLVTSDPDEALAFVADGGTSGLISKQVGFTTVAKEDPSATHNWDAYVRYTERVTAADLAHLEDLRLCPVILQREVPKSYELRVTVVGRRVFAVAIHSQANPRTAVDSRRHGDGTTPHVRVDLPDDVADRCLAMCRAEGLRYSAFDIIVTPEGRYVFIEVNPNGQYLWLEHATGVPISEAIADELAAPTPLDGDGRVLPAAAADADLVLAGRSLAGAVA